LVRFRTQVLATCTSPRTSLSWVTALPSHRQARMPGPPLSRAARASPSRMEVSIMLRFSKRQGRRRLALAGVLLPLASPFASPTTNQADVQLQTDLSHMVIRVDQADPLPPGGCTAGHAWHPTFGGCRRQETRSEVAPCAAGWTGSKVRYRTAYILQANAADVAYGDWGPWQESCSPPRRAGVVDTVIAKARGKQNGESSNSSNLSGNIKKQMQVSYGTMYGV